MNDNRSGEEEVFEFKSSKIRIKAGKFIEFLKSYEALAILKGVVALLASTILVFFGVFGGAVILAPVIVTIYDHKKVS